MTDQDVEIVEKTTPFQGYFRVDRYRLRHRMFAGGWTEVMQREVFERGHAVAALLYDPDRDVLVMIEQFRIGAFAAGRPAWLMEIVAGIIGDGETPEEVARREAVEETGSRIVGPLELIGEFLMTPGGSSETVTLYCGRVDAEGAGGIHGLEHEHEDIKVHVVTSDAAIRMLDDQRITNATTAVALSWFARHREALRRRWTGGI